MSEYISVFLQRKVIERAHDCCEYCLCPADYSIDFFQFDHIEPVCVGGLTILENLARSCGGCNGYKANKTHYFDPLTDLPCPLYNPRISQWSQHFQWNDDNLRLIGKTAIGRTTIELLRLNRKGVMNQRAVLKLIGLHPPTFML
jgi:HNH endonuclease